MGHPLKETNDDVQRCCVALFFDSAEIEQLNTFCLLQKASVAVFFRGQLLELFRWIALLSRDLPSDGDTFTDASVRRTFARAALLASDIWARRMYPDELQLDGGIPEARRRVLAQLRRSNMETAPGPHPFLTLPRGHEIAEHLIAIEPQAAAIFQKQSGLSLEDYYLTLCYIAVLGTGKTSTNITDIETCSLHLDALANTPGPIGELCRPYLERETLSVDDLSQALWGTVDNAEESDAVTFDLKPLRRRPILKASHGRGIVIDPTIFLQRANVGPLFYLVEAQPKQANYWFGQFGFAFEKYVTSIMQRVFPESERARRYIPNPAGRDEKGNTVELADGMLLDHETIVVFETKAVFLRDEIASPNADPTAYLDHVRERYGVSVSKNPKDRAIKGYGQLARTIRNLTDGTWTTTEFDLRKYRKILPVLVAYDEQIDAAVHSHFLAQEFASIMQPQLEASWDAMRREQWTIAHLFVFTIDDVEMLETSSNHRAIITWLEQYSETSPDRLTSFHNFLLSPNHRDYVRYNAWLISKRDDLFDRMTSRFYPGASAPAQAVE
jgi:hypothetical protein